MIHENFISYVYRAFAFYDKEERFMFTPDDDDPML